jgi:hypothetical protein
MEQVGPSLACPGRSGRVESTGAPQIDIAVRDYPPGLLAHRLEGYTSPLLHELKRFASLLYLRRERSRRPAAHVLLSHMRDDLRGRCRRRLRAFAEGREDGGLR